MVGAIVRRRDWEIVLLDIRKTRLKPCLRRLQSDIVLPHIAGEPLLQDRALLPDDADHRDDQQDHEADNEDGATLMRRRASPKAATDKAHRVGHGAHSQRAQGVDARSATSKRKR